MKEDRGKTKEDGGRRIEKTPQRAEITKIPEKPDSFLPLFRVLRLFPRAVAFSPVVLCEGASNEGQIAEQRHNDHQRPNHAPVHAGPGYTQALAARPSGGQVR